MRYEIEFTSEAEAEFAALRRYDQEVILDAIEGSLRHEPQKPARNRKLVVPTERIADLGITWELRVGAFRVFYDVVPPAAVVIIRIVRKARENTKGSLK